MNNSKSSGLGCGLLVILCVIFYVFQFLFTTSAGIFLLVVGVVVAIIAITAKRKNNKVRLIDHIDLTAKTLEDIAAGNVVELQTGFTLTKGEKYIYSLPNVALTEYQSTGSSYSGTSVGVSAPLFGNVRGNVSSQGGQITKNPEELMVVDQGRAIFTDKRIVFSGAKLVRDWDLAKTVELSPGTGGYNVRIAVSNRERTSGLQTVGVYDMWPGAIAEYVFKLNSEGAAKAKQWAKDRAAEYRAKAVSLREEAGIEPSETK